MEAVSDREWSAYQAMGKSVGMLKEELKIKPKRACQWQTWKNFMSSPRYLAMA